MTLPRLAASVFLLAGAVALVFGLAAGWSLFREAEPQFFVGPGETRLEVRRGEPRTLWVHVRSDPAAYGRFPPAPRVTVRTRSVSGEEVPFVPTSGAHFVSQRQSRRYAVGDLQFSRPGEYLIEIQAPNAKHDYSLSEAGHGRRVAVFALGTIFGLGGLIGGAVWRAFQRP
ncbi:MAG: hypothetical protein JSR82_18610 [Verrucomicrobia bacterium]|nr:hypothetical protein [Verrucomicrobiota bacterium]